MASTTVSNASVGIPDSHPRPTLEAWTRCADDGMARLRAVLERTDPADVPLRSFLVLIIDYTGSRAEAFKSGSPEDPPAPPPHLVGSFRNGLGEGCLRRDLALYLAEEVADCFSRLLAWKAGKATAEEDRHRLGELAQAQMRLLVGIRKVVLPPSDAS